MTHTVVALFLALGFAAGFPTGFLVARGIRFRLVVVEVPADAELEEVSDRGDGGNHESVAPVTLLARILGFLTRRGVAAVLLSVALLLSAAGAFLNVTTAGRVSDVVDCSRDYNQAAGDARDERDRVAGGSYRSERRLWRDLRAQIAASRSTIVSGTTPSTGEQLADLDALLESIDRRIAKLDEALTTRADNPYPDPAACDDGQFEGSQDSDTNEEARP